MIQSNNSSTVHPARFESGCPHPFAPGTDGPGTDALIGPATYASAASRTIWLSAASKMCAQMAKVQKAAMMAGVASKMQKLVHGPSPE